MNRDQDPNGGTIWAKVYNNNYISKIYQINSVHISVGILTRIHLTVSSVLGNDNLVTSQAYYCENCENTCMHMHIHIHIHTQMSWPCRINNDIGRVWKLNSKTTIVESWNPNFMSS